MEEGNRSRGGKTRRHGHRLVGAAAAVTIGMTPLAAAPAAHADLEDLIVQPISDAVSDIANAVDPGLSGLVDHGLDADGLVSPALAAADTVTVPDLSTSLVSLDTLLAGWLQTYISDPIHQLDQALTDGSNGGALGWLFGDTPGAAAATPTDPAALTNATIPLQVLGVTEPVIDMSVGGGPITPVLVDTGSAGLVIPIWNIGLQNVGLPTGFGVGAYSGGMEYVYVTVPTTVSFGTDSVSGLPLVTSQTPVNAVLFAFPTVPFGPWTIHDFLGGYADGILGIAPDAIGPTPGNLVVTDLPGDLGQGVLFDQPSNEMIFGPNPLTGGTAVDGVAAATLYVSINDGTPVAVPTIIDSGGVYGTMPASLVGAGQTTLPVGTTISVTTSSGQPLYDYTVTATNSPTVVTSSSMNTGNVPFAHTPVYISTLGSGQTIFGGTRDDVITP